jgi:hypothetical protein
MFPERGGDTTITIPDDILTSAKQDMYRHGGIPPTLIVCGTRKTVSILMPEVENHIGRAERLIHLAIQLAHSRTVGDIDLVVLVTEAWASPAREPFMIPSQDKNRCEVLAISALDGQTKEQKLLLFACIREPNGVVTDLKPLPVPALVKVEGPLLRAFLAGYRLTTVASLPTPWNAQRNKVMWGRGPQIPSPPWARQAESLPRIVSTPFRLAPNFFAQQLSLYAHNFRY